MIVGLVTASSAVTLLAFVLSLQVALMSVTVFPVRLLLVSFLMLLAWPFAFTASLGRSQFVLEPQTWWRRCEDAAKSCPLLAKNRNQPCVCVLRQVCGRVFTSDHESHVVLWRVPLDQSERGAGGIL